ncbi:hypothetical protein SLEP1_g8218 [Rubroshorea leprosula]|uniref:Uncharacterized protein n=1 Tax=Rubroshorea leprosula TaxID=152421 RepID=A0AAV5I103_9ROSI|nr:hypothetical protein SLEP1_g8218 [Rubroshorea leprosula]
MKGRALSLARPWLWLWLWLWLQRGAFSSGFCSLVGITEGQPLGLNGRLKWEKEGLSLGQV